MRPPVCEICDADVASSDGGGLVRFQADERSREWRHRAETEPGFVGHPPDTGWFCGAHLDAARLAAETRSFADGVRHVEAHARHRDVTTLTFAGPPGPSIVNAIPARTAEGVRLVLQRRVADLGAAFAADDVILRTSTSFRLDDTHDRSVVHRTVGPADLFERVDYERADGRLEAWLVEARVERSGVLLAMVSIEPFDRLQWWVGDERLRPWVDAVAADLLAQPADLLDPAPDLVGVELGRARLGANEGLEAQWVEWDVVAVDIEQLAQGLERATPELFAALGLGEAPVLELRSEREWSPMDGAQPPYCPYIDSTIAEGVRDGVSVSVRVVVAHWNDDEVANASVSMSIEGHLSIGAFGPSAGGRTITSLRLYRPTTAAVVEVVAGLVV